MAFAIWYNREDVSRIAAEFTRADLPTADKSFATACWNAGLNTWNTAPIETDPFHSNTPGEEVRRVVVDGKHQGKTITLQQFRDFLYRYSTASPDAIYLAALADDMAGLSGAQEPYP